MAIDSILHIFIGGFLTIFLRYCKVSGTAIFIMIVALSLGKEIYDHFLVLGHCYPACMDEHLSDFFFSLIFFAFYIPITAIIHEIKKPTLQYQRLAIAWLTIGLVHLSSFNLYKSYQTDHHVPALSSTTVCSAN
ncbi:MAG: hypothetical protein WC635_11745 [Bacteriovorax sp.]|jgi:hypothetical protein